MDAEMRPGDLSAAFASRFVSGGGALLPGLAAITLVVVMSSIIARQQAPAAVAADAQAARRDDAILPLAAAASGQTSAVQDQAAPVPFGEVPPDCLLLQDVCFDQQQAVLMGPEYRPQSRDRRPLPQFSPHQRFNFPWDADANPDPWLTDITEMPPVDIRAAGLREGAPDLRHPQFRRDILPLIFSPAWQENFGHTMGNSVAWLHAYLRGRQVAWADRVALVVQTPHGMALPPHWAALAGPLVPKSPVQTLADFSSRSTSSAEAGGRCYAEALMCSGSKEEVSVNITSAAAFLAQHYRRSSDVPVVTYNGGGGCHSSTVEAGSGTGKSKCVRVLFLTRNPQPAVRQILNIDELLQECSRWQYTVKRTGTHFSTACGSWKPTGDLQLDIAAVRSADVVVGAHGASMVNAFFMRPGGAIMEVFNGAWPWQVHRIWLDQDVQSQLQWWGLTVKDPAAFTPGELEATQLPHPGLYWGWQGQQKRNRDKNMRVPWAGLERLLQKYADVQAAGGLPAYRHRRAAKQQPVVYIVEKHGALVPGGTEPQGGPFRAARPKPANS